MPNTAVFPPLPAPEWSGVTREASEAFVVYCTSIRRDQKVLEETKRRLSEYESAIPQLTAKLRTLAARISDSEKQLTETKATITEMTIEDAEAQLALITSIPGFIGIRTDEFGSFIVAFRVVISIDGKIFDLGDFEVSYSSITRHETTTSIYRVIRRTNNSRKFAFSKNGGSNGVEYGYFWFYDQKANDQLDKLYNSGEVFGHLLTLLRAIAAELQLRTHQLEPVNADVQDPEYVWEGIPSTAAKSLAKNASSLANKEKNQKCFLLADAIFQNQTNRDSTISQLRQYNEEKSKLVVKIRELENQNLVVHDEASARRTLSYIMSLPGVMGMRLVNGKPVFHVRTSHVLDGRRYDMGDFEMHVGESRNYYDPRELIRIEMTRRPNDYRNNRVTHIYFHADRAQGGHYTGWFCFGNRADDLRRMLESGNLSDFMHLGVNTMNGINQNHRSEIAHYYREIAFDDVWRPPTRRPRRVTREEHNRRLMTKNEVAVRNRNREF